MRMDIWKDGLQGIKMDQFTDRCLKIDAQPLELCVPFKFRASHRLSSREEAHFHDWILKVYFQRTLDMGEYWVMDIVKIRDGIQPIVDKFDDAFLNGRIHWPTCEMLCQTFLWKIWDIRDKFQGADLLAVEVELLEDDTDGKSFEWGSAKLINPWR